MRSYLQEMMEVVVVEDSVYRCGDRVVFCCFFWSAGLKVEVSGTGLAFRALVSLRCRG